MPDWIVTAVNTSALAGVTLFGMWAIVSIARFLGPKITSFFEAHVSLINDLRSVLGRLVDTGADTARGVEALHVKTDGIQRSVDELKVDFHEVKEKVEEHDLILSRKEPRV